MITIAPILQLTCQDHQQNPLARLLRLAIITLPLHLLERRPDENPASDLRPHAEAIKAGLPLSNKPHHPTLLLPLLVHDPSLCPISSHLAGIEQDAAAGSRRSRSKVELELQCTPGDAATTICLLYFPYVD